MTIEFICDRPAREERVAQSSCSQEERRRGCEGIGGDRRYLGEVPTSERFVGEQRSKNLTCLSCQMNLLEKTFRIDFLVSCWSKTDLRVSFLSKVT